MHSSPRKRRPTGKSSPTDARTRCYYGETLPNPRLTVFPIGEIAKIGRALGVPLIVDNTAAPVLCRPYHSCLEYRHVMRK